MSLSVEEMNQQLPVSNALPGEAVPYYMASGEGARYEINGQLVTVIARAADTGGIFSAAYISGGMGAETPFNFLGLRKDWWHLPSDQQALVRTMLLIAGE